MNEDELINQIIDLKRENEDLKKQNEGQRELIDNLNSALQDSLMMNSELKVRKNEMYVKILLEIANGRGFQDTDTQRRAIADLEHILGYDKNKRRKR